MNAGICQRYMLYIALLLVLTNILYVIAYKSVVYCIFICICVYCHKYSINLRQKNIGAWDIPDLNRCLSDFLNDVEKSNSISYTMRTTWAHWSYEKCVVFYDPLASRAVVSGPDSNRISNQYLMDSGPSLITPTWLLRFVASLYLHR
jgi:hypothetical protein